MKTPLLSVLLGSILAVFGASGVDRSPDINDERALSPDGRFETYTTAQSPDGTGTRLFLRAAHSSQPGVLLRWNDRWIEAKWAPDSRFLAVIDGSDGHVTDVFVYRVLPSQGTVTKVSNLSYQSLGEVAAYAQAPRVVADLWYHTPNPGTYDVQWNVAGWDATRPAILLTKHSRASKPSRISVILKSPRAR